ncbi:MAG TPA: alpha/beta fold hydrolase, partial [Thermoanaerobaculia bacterium]|nr:alpha/beta fold hydrolase [Thermoanaerobaculia bacterium]
MKPATQSEPHPPTRGPRRFAVASVLGLLEGAWCSLRPFAEIRGSHPDEKFVEVEGRELYVEQAGAGEPVVLLHGFCCSSFSWRHVLPGLAERFRVIAPDLPGFGYSKRPAEPGAYGFPGLERAVLGLLDYLGLESCHLVGHSFGGALALWLAERHPDRVRSLTLVATALPELTMEKRQGWARYRLLNHLLLRSRLLHPSLVRKALMASWHDAGRVTPELVAAYRERLLVEGLEDAYFGFLAPIDEPPPAVALEAIEAPVLIVWGDDDRVIPLERAIAHLPRLRRSRFVVLERCGHLPMEEQTEAFLREILPFLDCHRRSRHERLLACARDLVERW